MNKALYHFTFTPYNDEYSIEYDHRTNYKIVGYGAAAKTIATKKILYLNI